MARARLVVRDGACEDVEPEPVASVPRSTDVTSLPDRLAREAMTRTLRMGWTREELYDHLAVAIRTALTEAARVARGFSTHTTHTCSDDECCADEQGDKIAAAIEALRDGPAPANPPAAEALRAIVDYFRENHDPRDWPGPIRDADELLHGRRA